MANPSIENASRFIDNLRVENGGLTNDDREFLQQTRPWILETLENVRRKLGASTKTLATNLYKTDSRFVYELIQNAEDNKYSLAQSSSEAPYLSFSLYQDRIVIDSNEDGFSEANIRAICSIGESTKACVQGYIGEKGIGFKSVFKAAEKVHIQSGPYSFAFEYHPESNDSGLGMVTPLNENHLDVPDGVRTRMILYLLESCDRTALRREFNDLPDALLLFLKKLTRLNIRIALPDGPEEMRSYSLSSTGGRASITKTLEGPNPATTTKHYWITKRWVTDMPHDVARKDINEAQVVLAFLLDEDDSPVIEEQHIFAFLPLRKMGYKFLIQSDFITQASREDVFDSPWNRRLLKEIVNAFIDSGKAFLSHSTLKYEWIRYIPTEPIADEFWGQLQRDIVQAVSSQMMFFSRTNTSLVPRDLLVVPDTYRDEDGEPLLVDLSVGDTAYLSDSYEEDIDLPILRRLGTRTMVASDFLSRLEKDLDRSFSRMQSEATTDSWHTIVANVLINAAKQQAQADKIKRLPIIPLANGQWARSFNASIFFPTSGGIDIPKDLPLCLVSAEALRNGARSNLFRRLGVTECDPKRVFPLMEQRSLGGGQTVEESLAFVQFMFWHNDKLPLTTRIRLAPKFNSVNNGWFDPSNTGNGWTYSTVSENPYSTFRLIEEPLRSDSVRAQMTEKFSLINARYYGCLENRGRRNDKTGAEWFESFFLIKHTPQLERRGSFGGFGSSSSKAKSPELEMIATYRPDSLLGVLQANVDQFNCEWNNDFKNVEVPILNSLERRKLCTTYLPLPKLVRTATDFGLQEGFGFLQEIEGITGATAGKWHFLDRFGVGIEEDVSFWLALLKQARAKDNVDRETVFKIYSGIQRFASSERDENDECPLDILVEEDFIYIPSNGSKAAYWTDWDDCLWNGPEWFDFQVCLKFIPEYQSLQSLFVSALNIEDAGPRDYRNYLKHIRSSNGHLNESKAEKIPKLYNALQESINQGQGSRTTRDQFKNEPLIYNPKDQSWYRSGSCIWAEDNIQLPEKISLATTYKGMQTFFVKSLGITKPNLEMHVKALKQKAQGTPAKHVIVQEIHNICAFDPDPENLTELSDCKCLPVKLRSGEVEWMDSSEPFAIVDRPEYGKVFAGKINILDFSLEESHLFQRFLYGLGLGERFTSQAVCEETDAQDGSIDQLLTDNLRKKAYAICRYAVFFGSRSVRSQPLSTHQDLQNIDVHVSDSIAKSVSITQDGELVKVKTDIAYVHLTRQNDKLCLYLPRDIVNREVCLARELPITLLRYFEATNLDSACDLGVIINARNLEVVDALLHRAGVIELEGVARPEDEDSGYDSTESETTVDTTRAQHRSASGNTYRVVDSSSSWTFGSQAGRRVSLAPSETESEDSDVDELAHATAALSITGNRPSNDRPNLYKDLLDALIHEAEDLSELPRAGSTVRAPMSSRFEFGIAGAISADTPKERDIKIGAAGELFVFELLSNLDLSNFTRSNWESSIRHITAVHPRYTDLTSVSSVEMADFVYRDNAGDLTEKLIDLGYLDEEKWRNHGTTTYYIEVKTTPGAVETPFNVSDRQCGFMEDMELDDGDASDEVYMIARVFSLAGGGTGLKLYLDPATLRKKRQLMFKAEKYTVTPA